MRQSPDEFLPPELALRAEALNNAPQRAGADYVLVWLQQSLRGDDHPVIDAASVLANRLGLPVLVYHGLRCDYPYASARLSRFILGASAAMGRSLRSRGLGWSVSIIARKSSIRIIRSNWKPARLSRSQMQ